MTAGEVVAGFGHGNKTGASEAPHVHFNVTSEDPLTDKRGMATDMTIGYTIDPGALGFYEQDGTLITIKGPVITRGDIPAPVTISDSGSDETAGDTTVQSQTDPAASAPVKTDPALDLSTTNNNAPIVDLPKPTTTPVASDNTADPLPDTTKSSVVPTVKVDLPKPKTTPVSDNSTNGTNSGDKTKTKTDGTDNKQTTDNTQSGSDSQASDTNSTTTNSNDKNQQTDGTVKTGDGTKTDTGGTNTGDTSGKTLPSPIGPAVTGPVADPTKTTPETTPAATPPAPDVPKNPAPEVPAGNSKVLITEFLTTNLKQIVGEAGAYGIMGNMVDESGLDPSRAQNNWNGTCSKPPLRLDPSHHKKPGTLEGTKGEGFGWVQNTADFLQIGLQNEADKMNVPWYDENAQIAYLKELLSPGGYYADLGDQLQATTDIIEATRLWLSVYEKPAGVPVANYVKQAGIPNTHPQLVPPVVVATKRVHSGEPIKMVPTPPCRSCGHTNHTTQLCPVLFYTDANNDLHIEWCNSVVGRLWGVAGFPAYNFDYSLPGYENRLLNRDQGEYHPSMLNPPRAYNSKLDL